MTRPVVLRLVSLVCALVAGGNLAAAVLPEDRTDVLYHYYEGDNIEIEGPAVLIRKKFGDSVSVSGNYYVDMITSASIDVVTTASPYSEDHEQWALSVDYLRGGTMMTVGFNRSEQDDHESDTVSFVVSQNLFGDLTTVTLAYALGNDIIGQSTDPTFAEDLRRHRYGVGLSQIMTRNLILTLNFEGISDEGYLNNPLPFGPLPRRRRSNLQLPGGALSTHPHQQCCSVRGALLPALSCRIARSVPLLLGHMGYRREQLRGRLHPPLARLTDLQRALPVLQPGTGGLLLRPVPAVRLPELPGTR